MLWFALLLSQLSLFSGRPLKEDSPLVILITGCSTGIGKSLALEFSRQPTKYKVWATMRSTKNWDHPQAPNFQTLEMDVSSLESVESTVKQIISVEGKIDVVINNAGYGMVGSVETVDISDAKVGSLASLPFSVL
jgi:NAD(P)-dependent dehydrogenase (short-subunit alcohol dehydrogenase family)